ncbi:DoxX family protein [Allosphingosinicella deserti]|uniref:DoxX family protein n=1 Tax=Allosphingosinicella deserti TaxID=2116704 RepID=UPI001E548C5B|nr:DoxX family protein [Sphingomonas deserti]
MTPAPIARLLRERSFAIAARLILTLPFWASGIAKLLDVDAAFAEAAHFALDPAWLVVTATILVQIFGSALVVADRWTWVGAGALGVFTALATIIAHPFWSMAEPVARFHERNTFLEHAGLIGGLMLAAGMTPAGRRR